MIYFTLKIAEIKRETKDVVTLLFKQPGLKKIKYLPGQYLTLIFRINNRKYIRPYSFSSAPHIDQTLNVTVKRVSGGIVSNHIADCLQVGDAVEVIEPMGDFTLENKEIEHNNHVILWGVGSGITPLFSIAKYALFNQTVSHITLVYGNQNFENAVFIDQIFALQKQYPHTFRVFYFHTKQEIVQGYPDIIEGRIDAEKVIRVLQEEKKLINTVHYICGPFGLKESVKEVLNKYNISQENIFSEDFDLKNDPKKFNNVSTQQVKINQQNNIFPVEVIKGKTILEAALDALIDLPYACQTGSCLLCKAQLINGRVRSILNQPAKILPENECLLCCSIPLTNDVEVLVI